MRGDVTNAINISEIWTKMTRYFMMTSSNSNKFRVTGQNWYLNECYHNTKFRFAIKLNGHVNHSYISYYMNLAMTCYDDVIKWKHFQRYWPFVGGNSPVPGELPAQRPVTWSFDAFFDRCLNKRLSKQSFGWSFEAPSRSLWRHCNDQHVGPFVWSTSLSANLSNDNVTQILVCGVFCNILKIEWRSLKQP